MDKNVIPMLVFGIVARQQLDSHPSVRDGIISNLYQTMIVVFIQLIVVHPNSILYVMRSLVHTFITMIDKYSSN